MSTYSATGFWLDAVHGSTAQTTAPGEYFPDMQAVRSAARRNRWRSVRAAIVWVPRLVTRQAARLVPASMNAALTARAEARAFTRDIKRLQELAPHLLSDIGIRQVPTGGYVMIETGESVAPVRSAEPVASARPGASAGIRIAAAPAAHPVNSAPQRAWRPATGRAPVAPAGVVTP